MQIKVGQKFMLCPVSVVPYLAGADRNAKPKPMLGRAVYINNRHGYGLIDFGSFRECFSFYGEGGLIAAQIGEKYANR